MAILAPVCLGVLDAEPCAQGGIKVRFSEMICLEGVPYRYDVHIKKLLSGPLTKAEIDLGTYYARSFYQDQINPYLYSGSPFGDPSTGEVVVMEESPGESGDNVHLFTNQQYQIAIRAVAIKVDTIAEDDNDAVVVSYSNGYQGIHTVNIGSAPKIDVDAAITGVASISSLPDLVLDTTNVPEIGVKKMPNLNVRITPKGQ